MACTILTGHLMSIGFEKSISNLAVASQKSFRMIPTPPYLKTFNRVYLIFSGTFLINWRQMKPMLGISGKVYHCLKTLHICLCQMVTH